MEKNVELPRQSGGLDIHIDDGIGFPSGNPLAAVWEVNDVAVDVTNYTALFEITSEENSIEAALVSYTHADNITVGTTDGAFSVLIDPTDCVFGNRELWYTLTVYTAGGSPNVLLRGKCTSHAVAGGV